MTNPLKAEGKSGNEVEIWLPLFCSQKKTCKLEAQETVKLENVFMR